MAKAFRLKPVTCTKVSQRAHLDALSGVGYNGPTTVVSPGNRNDTQQVSLWMFQHLLTSVHLPMR